MIAVKRPRLRRALENEPSDGGSIVRARRFDIAAERAGPVTSAVALGLISIPLVALTVFAEPRTGATSVGWQPVAAVPALLLTTLAILPAAIVGGSLGGALVATRPATAVLVVLAVSWPIGIAMLPLAANILGIRMDAAIVCIDACTAYLTNADPFSGLEAYLSSIIIGGSIGGGAPLAAIVGIAGWLVLPRGTTSGRIGLAVVSYAAFHLWSVMYAVIPFGCLAVGAITWASWLRRREAAA
jgi:hypothetical protein